MFLVGLIIFSVVVMTIAVVTYKLNEKTPCDHNWKEVNGGIKCSKCFRVIRRHDMPGSAN
jgi:hypothetical protein